MNYQYDGQSGSQYSRRPSGYNTRYSDVYQNGYNQYAQNTGSQYQPMHTTVAPQADLGYPNSSTTLSQQSHIGHQTADVSFPQTQHSVSYQTPAPSATQSQQKQQTSWRHDNSLSYSQQYAHERPTKRARVEQPRRHEYQTPITIPARSTCQSGTSSHFNGIALPQISQSHRYGVSYAQREPEDVMQRQESQPEHRGGHIDEPLEQQVRSLTEYNRAPHEQPTACTHNGGQIDQQGWQADQEDDADPNYQDRVDETTSVRPSEKQKKTRKQTEGGLTTKACQACAGRKIKCVDPFPCQECRSKALDCIPVRSRRRRLKRKHDDPPSELVVEPAPPPEELPPSNFKGWHIDHPSRKFLLHLPPVIGTYQHWNNKILKWTAMPKDIDAFREKIFKMERPFLLTSQQYADYWPHISNIYARSTLPTQEDNGTAMEVWECRQTRRQTKSQRDADSHGTGRRNRQKKNHLLESQERCKMRLRVFYYMKHNYDIEDDHRLGLAACNCVPEWIHIQRTGSALNTDATHNHSIEALDRFKRSDALMFVARHKVEEGNYMYATVAKYLRANYADVTKQVHYLTDSDVANANRLWRAKNRDVELVEEMRVETPQDLERKRCLDLVNTATVAGLRRALAEVCQRVPEAAAMVMPFIETAQEKPAVPAGPSAPVEGEQAVPDGDEDGTTAAAATTTTIATRTGVETIPEGDDIVIPEPGFPDRVQPRHPPRIIEVQQATAISTSALSIGGARQQILASNGQPVTNPDDIPRPPPGYRLQITYVEQNGQRPPDAEANGKPYYFPAPIDQRDQNRALGLPPAYPPATPGASSSGGKQTAKPPKGGFAVIMDDGQRMRTGPSTPVTPASAPPASQPPANMQYDMRAPVSEMPPPRLQYAAGPVRPTVAAYERPNWTRHEIKTVAVESATAIDDGKHKGKENEPTQQTDGETEEQRVAKALEAELAA